MARSWAPGSSDDTDFERQFRTAVEAGRLARETEPGAIDALYDAHARRVVVELRNGLSFAFPTTRFPVLDSLPEAVLASVRVTASGHGLHWDEADVHLAVPHVIAEVFGAFAAAETGRVGGSSRSDAKREAARRNARQGGRPATRSRYEQHPGALRVTVDAGGRRRSLTVRIGRDYVVDPLNPAARRFRGRAGTVTGIRDGSDGRVELRFHDTGRLAVVDASDLRPIGTDEAAAA